MTREQVIAVLKAHERELRGRGVRRIGLFGSLARGEARPDSDIDILIELDPGTPISLFDYAGLKLYIADLFPKPVDVVNRDALKPWVRPPAETDAVYVF